MAATEMTRKGQITIPAGVRQALNLHVGDPFIHLLRSVAVIVPDIEEDIPAVSRDRKDDYLLMHAVIDDINCLVTGDKDLLVLQHVHNTRIVSPAEFLAILDTEPDA